MTVQYNNPPHDLVTKEYREKNNSSYKMLFWEQCDDTNLDERIFSEVSFRNFYLIFSER